MTNTEFPLLEIRIEKPSNFSFLPGQFVRIDIAPDTGRFYSIASHPSDENLKFIIKYAPDGITANFFMNAKEGDEISVSDAMGNLKPPDTEAPCIFVATGTGIAPVLSLVSEMEHGNRKQPVRILWGVKTPEHAYDIETPHKIEHIYSQTEPFEHVTDILKRTEIEPNAHIYCIGSSSMVSDCMRVLKEKEIPPAHIHVEHFTPARK